MHKLVSIGLCSALLVGSTAHAQDRDEPLDARAGRIELTLGERLADTLATPLIVLAYRTEIQYGGPRPLLAALKREGRVYTLSDWRIEQGGSPLPIVSHASGEVPLPMVSGAYELVVRHRGLEDRYQVTLDASIIRIRAVTGPRVSTMLDTLIRRRIRNSIAVDCRARDWMCSRLFRELATMPGLRPFRVPEAGRNPFGLTFGPSAGVEARQVRYLMYASNQSLEAARVVIRRVEQEGGAEGRVGIVLGWEGR